MMHIVLAGAGHTHVELLLQAGELRRAGYEVSLVSPFPFHTYSGMGPGLVSGRYKLSDTVLPVAELARSAGVRYVADSLVGCDTDTRQIKLASGSELTYDVLSLNLGSEINTAPDRASVDGVHVFVAKPVHRLEELRHSIEERCRATDRCEVSVLGAGPAGLEIALGAMELIHRLRPRFGCVHLFHAGEAPADLRGERRDYVLRHLERAGVRFYPGQRCEPADAPGHIVVLSTGLKPPPLISTFGLPCGPDGSLRVDAYLRSVSDPRVFAVGDSAYFDPAPLDRVGVYAVRMQRVLLHNLLMGPTGTLEPFRATGPYLAGFNLGFGKGLLYRDKWTLYGRPAFRLKDAIDRRFIRHYRERRPHRACIDQLPAEQ